MARMPFYSSYGLAGWNNNGNTIQAKVCYAIGFTETMFIDRPDPRVFITAVITTDVPVVTSGTGTTFYTTLGATRGSDQSTPSVNIANRDRNDLILTGSSDITIPGTYYSAVGPAVSNGLYYNTSISTMWWPNNQVTGNYSFSLWLYSTRQITSPGWKFSFNINALRLL
jgi:uncharacterized Zn-binding protein involved in type VI secretion